MDYGQIKARFTKTLNRRDVTPTQIAEWIDDAIMRMQILLETPASEAVAEITVGEDFTRLVLPSDLLRIVSISVDGAELTRTTLSTVNAMARASGYPTSFVRDDNTLLIGPRPSKDSVIRLVYLSDFPVLTNDTDKNFVTQIAGSTLIAGAMYEACSNWAGEMERGETFNQKFLTGITDLNLMAKRDDLSNAAIAPGFTYGDF